MPLLPGARLGLWYETGDVVRYSKGSQAMGIGAGESATVEGSDRERNLLTIERESEGVTVYESERNFSESDG